MVRRASTEKFDRIEHLRERITLHQGDLLDQRSLVDTLRAAKPDEVYNLAAMRFVAVSCVQPTLTAEFTSVGVTRMLEAVREAAPGARFYQASSSEMFGKVLQVPQTADHAVLPALALRRGKGLRPLHHGQLSRVLRPLCLQRDPLQPRVRVLEHAADRARERQSCRSGRPKISSRCDTRAAPCRASSRARCSTCGTARNGRRSRAITATRRRTRDPDHRGLCVQARGGVVDVTAHHHMLDCEREQVRAGDIEPG